MVHNKPKVTIPLSLGEIYNALCPTCQQVIVDLVSAKAGPDFIRKAIGAQLAAGITDARCKEARDVPL